MIQIKPFLFDFTSGPGFGEYYNKLISTGNETGCFTKKNHVVIVRGSYDVTLFKKTRCKKAFNYYQPSDGVDSNGTVIIDIYEHDSYTQWDYKYAKNNFTKI